MNFKYARGQLTPSGSSSVNFIEPACSLEEENVTTTLYRRTELSRDTSKV